MLLKALLLIVILYLAFRAVRGIVRAVLEDPGAGRRSRPLERDRAQRPEPKRRERPGGWSDEEVEDARWTDL